MSASSPSTKPIHATKLSLRWRTHRASVEAVAGTEVAESDIGAGAAEVVTGALAAKAVTGTEAVEAAIGAASGERLGRSGTAGMEEASSPAMAEYPGGTGKQPAGKTAPNIVGLHSVLILMFRGAARRYNQTGVCGCDPWSMTFDTPATANARLRDDTK